MRKRYRYPHEGLFASLTAILFLPFVGVFMMYTGGGKLREQGRALFAIGCAVYLLAFLLRN